MWMIYEQVCIAACDCGRLDIAQVSIITCYSWSSLFMYKIGVPGCSFAKKITDCFTQFVYSWLTY